MPVDLRDSWVYQELFSEGYEEGIKIRREMVRQSILERWREMFSVFMRARHPEIADLAENRANAISDVETFYEIFMQVLLAKTQEEITAVLASTP